MPTLNAPTIDSSRIFNGTPDIFSTNVSVIHMGVAPGQYRGLVMARVSFTPGSGATAAYHRIQQTLAPFASVLLAPGVTSGLLLINDGITFGTPIGVRVRAEQAGFTSSAWSVVTPVIPVNPTPAGSTLGVMAESLESVSLDDVAFALSSVDQDAFGPFALTVTDADVGNVLLSISSDDLNITGTPRVGFFKDAILGAISRYVSGAWPNCNLSIRLTPLVAAGYYVPGPGFDQGIVTGFGLTNRESLVYPVILVPTTPIVLTATFSPVALTNVLLPDQVPQRTLFGLELVPSQLAIQTPQWAPMSAGIRVGPAATGLVISGLPTGLSYATAADETGTLVATITGTPTAAAVTALTVTASNTNHSETKAVTLTVTAEVYPNQPFVFLNQSTIGTDNTAVVGVPYSIDLQVQGLGTTVAIASGLPPGLSLSGLTISGTPTTAGSYSFTAIGTDTNTPPFTTSSTFTIGVSAIAFASDDATASGEDTLAFSYSITPIGTATSFSLVSGTLPTSVTLDTGTGVLSGTIDAGQSALSPFVVVLRATNLGGHADLTLTITVEPHGLSDFTSPSVVYAVKGQVMTDFTLTASNTPTSYTATPLPTGLSFATDTISGTPTVSGGIYSVPITVSNANGTRSGTLAIIVSEISSRDLTATDLIVRSGNSGADLCVDLLNRATPFAPMGTLPANLFYASAEEPAFFNVWFAKGVLLEDFVALATRFAIRVDASKALVYGVVTAVRRVNPVAPFYTVEVDFSSTQISTIKTQAGGVTGEVSVVGQLEIDIDAPYIGPGEQINIVCPSLPGTVKV